MLWILFLAAVSPAWAGGYVCTTNNGALTITGYAGFGGDVTIPAEIDGLPVTAIGYAAFVHCDTLTKVTIPTSVTAIGNWAFGYCNELTEVTISSGVASIGYYAFSYCAELTEVTIPSGVTSIENYAFQGCNELILITVDADNPVYMSADGVLFNKLQTTLIQYPEGKTGSYAIPSSITSIGSYAFGFCDGLTAVAIPSSVTNIGSGAFSYCVELTEVTIPSSVTLIDFHAFDNCTGLINVTIPSSVTSIEDGAFRGCDELTLITVDAASPAYTSADGVLFNKPQTTLMQYPGGKTGDYTISISVTNIEDRAFSDCAGLTAVTIPASVPLIGSHAFDSCTGLTNVTISSGVTSIGSSAFDSCAGLTEVTIPSSVTSIGNYAFWGCANLALITVDAANPAYMSVGGVLFNKAQTTLLQFPAGKAGRYTIPFGVTSIAISAFSDCNGLTEVTTSSSVSSIGTYAFFSCDGLTSVTISSSVTSIGISVFGGCDELACIMVDFANPAYMSADGVLFNKTQTELMQFPGGKLGSYTTPSSVNSIAHRAFYNCDGLTEVTISSGVFSIESEAFRYCDGLESVFFCGNAPILSSGVFAGTSATIYRLPEATDWPTVPGLWGDRPTALWYPDSDDDGLPDWWEHTYCGGATNANPSAMCSNGVNSLLEGYILGLNPTNANERFEVLDFTLGAQDEFRWNAVSGRVYSVYWTTNLLSGFQYMETNIPWTQGGFTNTPSAPCGYYKVEVELE